MNTKPLWTGINQIVEVFFSILQNDKQKAKTVEENTFKTFVCHFILIPGLFMV